MTINRTEEGNAQKGRFTAIRGDFGLRFEVSD